MTLEKPQIPAPAFASIDAAAFEALKAGDTLINAAGEAFYINQVRLPGWFVVSQVDPKTGDRVSRAFTTITAPTGYQLHEKKPLR